MARITVEDCLREENNRFSLVLLASKRAKQLLSGAEKATDTRGNKSVVSALREIADGKVGFEKYANEKPVNSQVVQFGVEPFTLDDLPPIEEPVVVADKESAAPSDKDVQATIESEIAASKEAAAQESKKNKQAE